jgi:hypothetical protein
MSPSLDSTNDLPDEDQVRFLSLVPKTAGKKDDSKWLGRLRDQSTASHLYATTEMAKARRR